MENYFKLQQNLRGGEKDSSVVKSQSRSQSVDVPRRMVATETAKPDAVAADAKIVRKIAFKTDIDCLKLSIEQISKSLVDKAESDKKTIDELSKKIDGLKHDEEYTKTDKLKLKLDNFIDKYNENENAHSNHIQSIETQLKVLDDKVSAINEMI